MQRRRFTPEEDARLRCYPLGYPRDRIARDLGRSPSSVQQRLAFLGRVQRIGWTQEDDARLLEHVGKIPLAELALMLGRRPQAICDRAGRVYGKSTRVPRRGEYAYRGSRRAHVIVMEQTLGRKLAPGEQVHHIDADKHNNDPDNLFLCKTASEHNKAHWSLLGCLPDLLRRGAIRFDHQLGTYVVTGGN